MSNVHNALGEKRWVEVCNAQRWNEESQIIHLEGFIRAKGLMAELADYAEEMAAEENQ